MVATGRSSSQEVSTCGQSNHWSNQVVNNGGQTRWSAIEHRTWGGWEGREPIRTASCGAGRGPHTRARARTHTHTYMHTCTHTRARERLARTSIQTQNAHKHTHARAHTHTHTHTQDPDNPLWSRETGTLDLLLWKPLFRAWPEAVESAGAERFDHLFDHR